MKKLLSILGAISLVGTSTTSLIACDKPTNIDNTNTNKTTDTSVSGILAGKWLGVLLPLDFFQKISGGSGYYLVIKNELSSGNDWKGNIFYYPNYPRNLLNDYKIYIWMGGSNNPPLSSDIPNIDKNTGSIISV